MSQNRVLRQLQYRPRPYREVQQLRTCRDRETACYHSQAVMAGTSLIQDSSTNPGLAVNLRNVPRVHPHGFTKAGACTVFPVTRFSDNAADLSALIEGTACGCTAGVLLNASSSLLPS